MFKKTQTLIQCLQSLIMKKLQKKTLTRSSFHMRMKVSSIWLVQQTKRICKVCNPLFTLQAVQEFRTFFEDNMISVLQWTSVRISFDNFSGFSEDFNTILY